MQDIRFQDIPEVYSIVPLRGGQRNTVQGLTILVNNRFSPYFLEQHLAPASKDVIDYVAKRFAVKFKPFIDFSGSARKGLGFNRGVRLSHTQTGDWSSHTRINILFQRARRIPQGCPGYVFALNMYWLLQSLQNIEHSGWTDEGPHQLFAIDTSFSSTLVDTAVSFTAIPSQACTHILTNMTSMDEEKITTKTQQAVGEARRWYRSSSPHDAMPIEANEPGPIRLQSNPWHIRYDSNGKLDYKQYSATVAQIVALVGVASFWEELRNHPTTPA